ncbi:hypothetical protein EDF39_2437 [Frondihabitans sp. PhB161]|nr:hypothetical protein EDF37_1811 [Frondihabitans sp. PhB153]RPF05728.1 hypothetical protein EDF39_2437 [Frondihabitans sp. PhB161]
MASRAPTTLSTVAQKKQVVNAPDGIRRAERVLVYAAITVAVFSAVCIAIYLIGGAAHVTSASGIWPAIAVLPVLGFPIAILLIIAFVIVSAIRRQRETRGDTR